MTKTKFQTPEFRLPSVCDLAEKIGFIVGDFDDQAEKKCARLCLHSARYSNSAKSSESFYEIYASGCGHYSISQETAREVLEHLMERDFVEHNGKIIWPYLNGVAQ